MSRAVQIEHVALAEHTVIRYEHILNDDIIAAGRAKTHYIPRIDNIIVTAGQQEIIGFGLSVAVFCNHIRAQNYP